MCISVLMVKYQKKDIYLKFISKIIHKLRLIWYIFMEYQKMINFLDNVKTQLFKFTAKN